MASRRVTAGAAVAILLLAAALTYSVRSDPEPAVRELEMRVDGVPEPGGGPVKLDATLYLPDAGRPAPAVLLAHGFGGSKASVAEDARDLAREGYVVLAFSARGFGASGGLIHIDAPDFEVADATRMLDLLADRPEVLTDAGGDPRVGVVGGSYGGGLALLLAGSDRRVDAIVPSIAWNDLGQALFPQQRSVDDSTGVFKRGWAGVLFGSGAIGTGAIGGGADAQCGRFAPDVCAAYLASAEVAEPVDGIDRLLGTSSPRRILDQITAPTLLLQGQTDGLFPLSEATANAKGIAAAGTPVKVVWFAGGHDGGDQERDRLRRLTLEWLGRYLQRDGSPPDTRFEISAPTAGSLGGGAAPEPRPAVRVAAGLGAARSTTTVALQGPPQTTVSPAGGSPAALTSVPGAGTLLGTALAGTGAGLSDLPGQTASFESEPLRDELGITGSSTFHVSVESSTSEATLFAKLYDIAPDGRATLPRQLVAPVHLDGRPGVPRTVRIELPNVVMDVPAGHRLRVSLSSTDQSFAVPTEAREYRIALGADSSLLASNVPTTVLDASDENRLLLGAGAAALLLLVAAGAGLLVRRRHDVDREEDPDLHDVPLVIEGLGKEYQGGYRAVSDLSLRVEAGQVLGLLGPNGAGKTTTLRMLMGLIVPTEGHLTVFGHRIRPGAPVLSRIGSFIEGPGFLPHLSGLANLELFWQATGRPKEQAQLESSLEVAGLGEGIHRRVRTYSQGMRQRLAIAQAMLGLPDLLVLDEPTNGLDPPQIREMRDVLARYAASGRTVVVSSHLLAEVEQTCSHVVVMNRGRLVAQGPVAELVGSATAVVVDVDEPQRAAEVAATLPGAHDLVVTDRGITLRLTGTPRADLVDALVSAGIRIDRLAPQRGLEQAFLALIGEDVP